MKGGPDNCSGQWGLVWSPQIVHLSTSSTDPRQNGSSSILNHLNVFSSLGIVFYPRSAWPRIACRSFQHHMRQVKQLGRIKAATARPAGAVSRYNPAIFTTL